jgi:predicted CXXCH cytochrome family protein
MSKQTARKMLYAWTALASILVVFAIAWAEEKKEIPDHTNFKSCQACHADKHSMWEASGHSKAIGRIANAASSADCYACHSTEGFSAKRQGSKVDPAKKESFHSISCLACHDTQSGKHPRKLVAEPEELCESCHSQRAMLKGEGAKGVEDLRNVHSAVSCVSCHMTEGNHRMKVLRPDDQGLTEKRADTCTGCHKDNNRVARVRQLTEWQSDYKAAMDPIQADLKAINDAVKGKPDLLDAAMKETLSNLTFNLSLLERDGSRGAHNHDYALEIMTHAAKELQKIKAAIKR